jgi:ribonuclease HI
VALIIHVDGGSRGNPGPAGAGVVIETEEGQLIHEAGYFLGKQTNNAAEYHALLRALTRAQRCDEQALRVYSDSELLVRQLTGEYEVKSPKLAPLYRQAQTLLLRVPRWSFRHIRREHNKRADELANLAMDQERNIVVFDVDHSIVSASAEAAPEAPPASAPEASADTPVPARPSGAASAVTGGESPAPVTGAAAPHAVRVSLAQAPQQDTCPVGVCVPKDFTVQDTLPVALCIYAAHTLLPTLLAMLHTAPEEFAAVPTLTVRCNRAGCGAVFHLAPVRSPNGSKRRQGS